MYAINFSMIYIPSIWVSNSAPRCALPFKGRVRVGMGENFTNKINPSPSVCPLAMLSPLKEKEYSV